MDQIINSVAIAAITGFASTAAAVVAVRVDVSWIKRMIESIEQRIERLESAK